jgi:hypothetical protein
MDSSERFTIQTRRPSYLVPNVKEYGWTNPDTDPTNKSNRAEKIFKKVHIILV